jgi:hypothetical protein
MQRCIALAKASKNSHAAIEIERILLRLASDKQKKVEYDSEVAAGKKPTADVIRCCLFCLKKLCWSVSAEDVASFHVMKRHKKGLKILNMKPEEVKIFIKKVLFFDQSDFFEKSEFT